MESNEKPVLSSKSRHAENNLFYGTNSFSRAGITWFSLALIILGVCSIMLFISMLDGNISQNQSITSIAADVIGIGASAIFVYTGVILMLELMNGVNLHILQKLGLAVSSFFILAAIGTFLDVNSNLNNLFGDYQWLFYLIGGVWTLAVSLLARNYLRNYALAFSLLFIAGMAIVSVGSAFVVSGFSLISSAGSSTFDTSQGLMSNPYYFITFFGVYGSNMLFFVVAIILVSLSTVIYLNNMSRQKTDFKTENLLYSAGIIVLSAGLILSVFSAFSSNFLDSLYTIYLTGYGIPFLLIAAEFLVALSEFLLIAAAVAFVLYAVV